MGDARRAAIENALTRLKLDTARLRADRDMLVAGAVQAGIAKLRVHQLTGISRATIDRILKGEK